MLWRPTRYQTRPRRLTRALLALLLAAPLLAHSDDQALDFNRYSGTVGPGAETSLSFTGLYEENRDLAIGDLITVDLLAHAMARLWQNTLPVYETETVAPRLSAVVTELHKALAQEPETPATLANRDFLEVVQALLTDKTDGLSERARAEYQLAQNAAGESASPLFGYRMDYSQFKPRGAYTESESRQRFFRAYRYAATALFPFVPSAALGLDAATGQRLLEQLAQWARLTRDASQPPAKTVEALNTSIAALLPGQPASADLAFVASVAAVPDDPLAWGQSLLKKAQQEGRQPLVFAASVDVSQLENGLKVRDVLTGYRLAPLLEVADSRLFQRVVYAQTGAWQTPDAPQKPLGLGMIDGFGPAKVRPLVDEWVAALGLTPLRDALQQHGETAFAQYPTWDALQTLATPASGLEALRVKAFSASLQGREEAWQQRAETVKGLWTEFKHAELLYQAQSYTGTAKSLGMVPIDSAKRGAVIEPAPQAIRALQAFSAELANRVPSSLRSDWEAFSQDLQRAATLADMRTPLAAADQAFLRGLPKHLNELVGGSSLPVVVDIHTGVEGQKPAILHAATGFVREAALTVNQQTYRGARYRFFSFSDAQRWTDEQWREVLARIATREQQAWRLKVTPELLRAVVLARASRDEQAKPAIGIELTDVSAAAELSRWAGERGWSVKFLEATVGKQMHDPVMFFPLAAVPELAAQTWIKHLDILSTAK